METLPDKYVNYVNIRKNNVTERVFQALNFVEL